MRRSSRAGAGPPEQRPVVVVATLTGRVGVVALVCQQPRAGRKLRSERPDYPLDLEDALPRPRSDEGDSRLLPGGGGSIHGLPRRLGRGLGPVTVRTAEFP